MELNPFVQGAITAAIYIATFRFLPKKLRGAKRIATAIAVTVALSLFVQFIIDCIAETVISN